MKKYCGWIIFANLVLFVVSNWLPAFRFGAAAFAWLVPVLMWNELGKSGRKQVFWLLLPGIAAMVFGFCHGVFLGWEQILTANLPLLAMFASVAFLSLTNKTSETAHFPEGKRGVATTAVGTHLLGAVINLSILFVVGDRLAKKGVLTMSQMLILSRSFCAAAWWSPFFIATGVAFLYAPEMRWSQTLIPGGIMSCVALGYSVLEVIFLRKGRFYGYPMKAESLFIPVLMAMLVIVAHYFFPEVKILLFICFFAPAGAIVFMQGRPRWKLLHNFVESGLVSLASQFALFLAAGVFSSGVMSLIQVFPEVFSFNGAGFTPTLFAEISAAMITAGFFGIHPIVSVAIVSPLLMPMNPDHSQLGFLFLTSWAVSTGSSPLSGVGLTLIGRYHATPWQIVKANYHYAIGMWGVACLLNVIFFE